MKRTAHRLLPLIALGSLLGACGGAPERQPLEAPSIATLVDSPATETPAPAALPVHLPQPTCVLRG